MVGLRFDLRVPPFARTTHARQYAACLDMCEWADAQGFDVVAISEHHGVDDGYMSSPVTLAAAIAARTKRLAINVAAILVPLHDPIRLAEQLATAALVAGGRLSFVAGLGYRHEEFAMAGVERAARGRLFDEYVGVLRQAWTGEPFTWRGRVVRVTPAPPAPPPILVGGSTAKAARRAARLRCGFFPAVGDPELARVYQEACAAAGFEGGFVVLPGGPGFVHVTRDPEADWKRIAPHAFYDASTYAAWQTPGQRSEVHVAAATEADVRHSDVYRVVTPEECVTIAERHGRVLLHPLMGGIEPELAWASLRLFADEVLPRLRTA
jgi:alkanesulfonate monooxygenase SsuD/methylene tetrahydromethanopterin reductase-like flavin-dependent oxidoreductase (luciferase family)